MSKLYDIEDVKDKIIMFAVETGKNNISKIDSLKELKQLIETTDSIVLDSLIQNLEAPSKKHYLGKGKIEELQSLVELHQANCVVCDDELTNTQIKFLESALDIKVIDRTLVILDIFARRATTNEGKIQVELAMLQYRLTHLVGENSNLHRQAGGIGAHAKGPGETKLEMNKRLIRDRITELKGELKRIDNHRELLREQKSKKSSPVVAIVGYTNAGKSTLLNSLTNSNVLSEDKLFATLETTTRKFDLPNGNNILLVDTVGFIQNLPHHLVKSFQSTLDEVKYCDVILHVVDSSSELRETCIDTVHKTLETLNVYDKPILTLFNKIDLLEDKTVPNDPKATKSLKASIKTGDGVENFINTLEELVLSSKTKIEILLPYEKSSLTSYIHKNCDVIEEDYRDDGIYFKVYGIEKDEYKLSEFII